MVAMIPPQLPIVQIRQVFAQIGIDADLGVQQIRQPRPTMEMQVDRPRQSIEQPSGQMTIDQSKAWDALALGGNLQVMNRIYTGAREIAMQGIARIVEEGNRLAAIHLGGNPLADMAANTRVNFGEYSKITGPASFDNVDIHFERRPPVIQAENGQIHMRAQANPVQHEYQRGKLDISMLRYPSISFIPPVPELDVRV